MCYTLHYCSNKNKTFKPLKNHDVNTKRHKLSEFAKATLGSGNMRSAVMLPKGEDINEWYVLYSIVIQWLLCLHILLTHDTNTLYTYLVNYTYATYTG